MNAQRDGTSEEIAVFGGVEEGLDLLLEGQTVMHMGTGMLKGYFQANPFRQQNLKTFARSKATFYALIVSLNSPLKPILQMASNKLLEAGTMDYLVQVWEGMFDSESGILYLNCERNHKYFCQTSIIFILKLDALLQTNTSFNR